MEKSLSQCGSTIGAGTRSLAVSSRQKFENLDKLHGIVTEIQQNSSRTANPDQVLDVIKNKIKANYNNLYDNYEANKNQILRNIQQTENHNVSETVMKNKIQHVIKQKAHYDRIKAETQFKQKKLKKLLDLREQLKSSCQANQGLRQVLADRTAVVSYLQAHKQTLDYESSVLKNMEEERKRIKLYQKEKHQLMRKDENTKQLRMKKMMDAIYTKKIILQGIQDKIGKQDICELPQTLMEELQKKLENYQGKHSQSNILLHETKLSEARLNSQRNAQQKQNQVSRRIRLRRQQEQKKEFQIAYNHLMFKQSEEQKIKKLCGVNEITELADNKLETQKNNLDHIRIQLQEQIQRIRSNTKDIEDDIEKMMTNINQINNKVNPLALEKQLEAEQTQLRRLKMHIQKKQANMNDWESIIQLIVSNSGISVAPQLMDKYHYLNTLRYAVIPKLESLQSKQNYSDGLPKPKIKFSKVSHSYKLIKDDPNKSEDFQN